MSTMLDDYMEEDKISNMAPSPRKEDKKEQESHVSTYHHKAFSTCSTIRLLDISDKPKPDFSPKDKTKEDSFDEPDEEVANAYQNRMGMTVTSGVVTLKKENNFVGISIGGGAPLCPCLYIVQVFDNTPAARDGTLQSGDELVGINGVSAKGRTKVQAAKMIQSSKEEVSIAYNKLHADPSQGRSLDIILKKVKHRLVENLGSTTADALGLSRAILCSDSLVLKLKELESTENEYRGLVDHSRRVLKAYYDLFQIYRSFGNTFAEIGAREPQPRASETFTLFANYHRQLEKHGITMLRNLKPILSDLGTYLYKAIPDTRLTIRKYADAKFEYLSYCLKVKEMDDEEKSFNEMKEPLYRVETGNYEYRLILRCRQEARVRFARLRCDVLVKLELLDNKHVQDVTSQLERLVLGLAALHTATLQVLDPPGARPLFPIEMDLARSAFQYQCSTPLQDEYEDDDQLIVAEEAKEDIANQTTSQAKKDPDNPAPLLADF